MKIVRFLNSTVERSIWPAGVVTDGIMGGLSPLCATTVPLLAPVPYLSHNLYLRPVEEMSQLHL